MVDNLNFSKSDIMMKTIRHKRNYVKENNEDNNSTFNFVEENNDFDDDSTYYDQDAVKDTNITNNDFNGRDISDESSYEISTYKPCKIRISLAAVSSSTYVRTKNSKKKKKSLSFFLMRGPTLESVPEENEILNFKGAISIGKSKRFNDYYSRLNQLSSQLQSKSYN